MIKTLKICMIGLAIFSATGCSKPAEATAPAEEVAPMPAVNKEGAKTEKSVAAIAAKLGLEDGEAVEDTHGAIEAATYSARKVSLYIFDKTSEEYKNILNGGSGLDSYCCNEGAVLVFTGDEVDVGLMTHFYELSF